MIRQGLPDGSRIEQTHGIPAAMAASVMDGYHSVVIWDTDMAHAIAAASLKQAD